LFLRDSLSDRVPEDVLEDIVLAAS
jgi:hypothetical protein